MIFNPSRVSYYIDPFLVFMALINHFVDEQILKVNKERVERLIRIFSEYVRDYGLRNSPKDAKHFYDKMEGWVLELYQKENNYTKRVQDKVQLLTTQSATRKTNFILSQTPGGSFILLS